MQTQRWNPWPLFAELERTVFTAAGSQEWPAFEIDDHDDETLLTTDVPGMTEHDLELTIAGSTLVIRGERTPRRRAFAKQLRLGEGYDLDHIDARVANGVLTITLPKTEKAKPRRIKIASSFVDKVKALVSGDKQQPAA